MTMSGNAFNTGEQSIDALQGAQMHSDGHRCDLEYCQECGRAFTPALEGFVIGREDLGAESDTGTVYVFREDAENFGDWQGFNEEDIGAWCGKCSWGLQRRRTQNRRHADA